MRRRLWLQDSLVVVKESADPLAVAAGLEELLGCYLALNAAKHHCGIVAAFRHTWLKYRL